MSDPGDKQSIVRRVAHVQEVAAHRRHGGRRDLDRGPTSAAHRICWGVLDLHRGGDVDVVRTHGVGSMALNVPQLQVAIHASRGQEAGIKAPDQAVDRVGVTLELLEQA